MPSADLLNLGSSPWIAFALRAAWQSTALLATALLAAGLFPMRPSRAHRILLAAAIACLVVPAASLAARKLDCGLFRAAATPIAEPPRVAAHASPPGPTSPVPSVPAPERIARPASLAAPPQATVIAAAPASPPREAFSWQPRPGVVLPAAWALAAAVGLARLLASFAAAARIRARSRPVADRDVLAAADAAARYLGLSIAPLVRSSADVHCPVVWCWGRRPVLIVPDQAETWGDERLAAVLCHELAHWLRADHASAFIAELLTCLLPWQPLAWLARHRMADLAELACDDWALAHARSVSPDDYVEALLGLATNRRRPLVPAAVSSRAGLVARARHILEEGCSMPTTGKLWNALIVSAGIGLVSILALAQTRQAKALAAAKDASGRDTVVEGVVRDVRGNPIPGAEVIWIGNDRLLPGSVERPLGHPDHDKRDLARLAASMTDAQGRFTLQATIRKLRVPHNEFSQVVAHKAGLAPGAMAVPIDGQTEVILKPAAPIVGHLLTPGGEPAANVPVRLRVIRDGSPDPRRELYMPFDYEGRTWKDRPTFLRSEFRTDASGKFVIDGYVPAGEFAFLGIQPPGYGPEELTVATDEAIRPTDTLWFSNVQLLPREFTHTLTEDRPVVGTVTDEVTHEPLAGVGVGLVPMHPTAGGGAGGTTIHTTTDAKGRYRFSHRAAESYELYVTPEVSAGYLKAEKHSVKWPAGAPELKIDMALRRGVLLRGKVVDEATGAGVPDATVTLQHLDADPNARRGFGGHRGITVTDARGNFAITGVPGSGVLMAEASDRGFVRTEVGPVDYLVWPTPFLHGKARVEVQAAGTQEPSEVTLRLRRGLTLEAKVIRPDGSAADDARAWCAELAPRAELDSWLTQQPPRDGLFRMPGAEPGQTYRIYFLTDDMKYGAVAEIRADATRTWITEVKLLPAASMHGRLLDADGRPRTTGLGHDLRVTSRTTDCQMPQVTDFALTAYTCFPRKYPQQEGNAADFHYTGLIPGVRYFLGGSPLGDTAPIVIEPLTPGEDRDLGDLLPTTRPRPNIKPPAADGVASSLPAPGLHDRKGHGERDALR